MSYFDPEIYCKENLSEEDRKALDFFHSEFNSIVCTALDVYDDYIRFLPESLKTMTTDIINDFIDILNESINAEFDQLIVDCIERYDHEFEDPKNPNTHYSDDQEDEDDE